MADRVSARGPDPVEIMATGVGELPLSEKWK
jgi:hypothetical protein